MTCDELHNPLQRSLRPCGARFAPPALQETSSGIGEGAAHRLRNPSSRGARIPSVSPSRPIRSWAAGRAATVAARGVKGSLLYMCSASLPNQLLLTLFSLSPCPPSTCSPATPSSLHTPSPQPSQALVARKASLRPSSLRLAPSSSATRSHRQSQDAPHHHTGLLAWQYGDL